MDTPSRQDVERQLRLVLAAPEFEASPKLSELLYYLVTQTLAGHGDRLKGYTIGLDVFAREPGFDQGVDAIVRVQMGRLRRLLTAYYAGAGAQDPLRIILVRGRYQPRFELANGEALEDMPPPDSQPAPAARPGAEGQRRRHARRFSRRHRLAGLALVGLLLVGLIATVLLWHDTARQPPPADDPAIARPQGSLVYVAHYRVIGSDPLAEQLSTGLQYDLVNQLSKFPDIAVLGLDSVDGASEREAEANPKGANFVLGGAIEVAGKSVRITSQLKRTRDGVIIWSDQATADSLRPVTIIAVQADIATSVASKLGQSYGVISQAMAQELAGNRDSSLDDYKCVVSAYDYMRRKRPEKHRAVRACLEQVVAHSPRYSTAWALLSWIYGDEERFGYNRAAKGDGIARALRAAQQAVASGPNNPTAHQYLALARFEAGMDDAAVRESAETALRLSPNNAEILANGSWLFAHLDKSRRALDLGFKAIQLNPGHPAWYWNGPTIYALRNGLKEQALRYARLNNVDHTIWSVYLYAAALRLNGKDKAADDALVELGGDYPQAISERDRMMRVLRIPREVAPLIGGD